MNHLPYKLLIFDWDGTLMDSEAKIINCLRAACIEHGFIPGEDEQLKDVIGLGLREALLKLHPEENDQVIEKLADSYRQHYLEINDTHSPLFSGVENLLAELEDQGYWLAIATGKGRQGLDKVLQETQLGSRFHITRCASETLSKPHPRMLEEILEFTGLKAHEALMIGDSEYDMEMAKNANMDALAVSYGVHAIDRLLKHNPVDCLHDINELPHCLHKINQEKLHG